MPRTFAPDALVRELRRFHATKPHLLNRDLPGFRLTRLPWGPRNHSYVWEVPYVMDGKPDVVVCLKLYTSDPPHRAWREAFALQHIARLGAGDAPRCLWRDDDRAIPAIITTLLPGDPVSALPTPSIDVLRRIVVAFRQTHALPLGRLDTRPRPDALANCLHDLTVAWPETLAANEDSLSRDLLVLVTQWRKQDGPSTLNQFATPVLSSGNANMDHWLWDVATNRVHLVDWSSAGCSDVVSDAADLIEHPTARAFSDEDWMSMLPDLGIHTAEDRHRFVAVQRGVALKWLYALWRQRRDVPNQLADQYERVHALMSRPWV